MKTIIILLLLLTACTPVPNTGTFSIKVTDINTTLPDPETCKDNGPDLTLTAFDVGQGQSVLIDLPYEHNLLFDAGPGIRNYGNQLRNKYIKYLVLSNPDRDHIGGTPFLAGIADIENVWTPITDKVCETKTCEEVRKSIDDEFINNPPKVPCGINYKYDSNEEPQCSTTPQLGNSLLLRGTHTINITYAFIDKCARVQALTQERIGNITTLNPQITPFNNDNDDSIVLWINYRGKNVLLMGDCEKRCEQAILKNGNYPRNVDILLAGHHGSRTSSSQEFVNAINPKNVIISAGLNNQYGHPHQEAIDRFNRIGANIYRTDLNGSIHVVTNGENIQITTGD